MRSSLPRYGFAFFASIVTVIVGFVAAAQADPISDEQAKATAIQDSIEANGERISALSEQYDAAQLRLQQAEQTAAEAEAQIAVDQAQITQLGNTIETRDRNLYEAAAAGESLAILDLTDARQVLTGSRYAEAAARQEQLTLNEVGAATADLARTRDQAKRALDAAASDAAQLDQAAQQLQASNEEQYEQRNADVGPALGDIGVQRSAEGCSDQGVADGPQRERVVLVHRRENGTEKI